jgi:uncharacterized membrane protein
LANLLTILLLIVKRLRRLRKREEAAKDAGSQLGRKGAKKE